MRAGRVSEQVRPLYMPLPAEAVGSYSKEDWNYATAYAKPLTHGFHTCPAMMIPQVTRHLIRMYGQAGYTLLDPFCGSGTSLGEARLVLEDLALLRGAVFLMKVVMEVTN